MEAETSSLANTSLIKRRITKYEKTIFSFFRELNLPLKFREIIRAYIVASDGNTFFEASYNDLTNILFKRSTIRFRANKSRTRSNVRALKKWQQDNGIELIRIVEEGNKRILPDGGEEYLKTKYELVLLDELVQVLFNSPSEEINERVKEVVARMKEINVPEKRKEMPTIFKLQRNRSAIFTMFGKTLEQAREIKLNPIKYGESLLSELNRTFSELAELFAEKENRKRRISEFKEATNSEVANTYENEGVANSHTLSLGNTDRNLPSDNRISSVYMDSEIDYGSGFLNSAISEDSGNQLLSAALNYAKAGYPVVPLHTPIIEKDYARCSCKEWRSCDRLGKHPRTWHGLLDATTNVETIKLWWRKWPNANIGLLTGKKSSIFVLDVDPKSGGLYSLEELQDSYGELPSTLKAISGSGGRHLIFKYPGDVKLKNSVSLIAPGLDIKSDNGYIVASPSLHISGGRYQWHGVNTPILDAPDWLIALILLAEEEGQSDKQDINDEALGLESPVVYKEPIKKGEGRNTYLHRQASGLINSYGSEEVKKRLQAKNLARCVPPVDNEELARILKSAETYRFKQDKKSA